MGLSATTQDAKLSGVPRSATHVLRGHGSTGRRWAHEPPPKRLLTPFAFSGRRPWGYVDLDGVGSGIETVAHLKENGRIVLMFCSFTGAPRIVRLYGRGMVHSPSEPEFEPLAARFVQHALASARAHPRPRHAHRRCVRLRRLPCTISSASAISSTSGRSAKAAREGLDEDRARQERREPGRLTGHRTLRQQVRPGSYGARGGTLFRRKRRCACLVPAFGQGLPR